MNVDFERLVPNKTSFFSKKMIDDHYQRYFFALDVLKNFECMAIADIACGSGYGSYELAKGAFGKIYAIDCSEDAISYAKENYKNKNIKYIVGDALKIPLPDNSVGGVVSFETLEHLNKHKDFISEIKRILKKNGLLIISTPNRMLSLKDDNPFHFKEFSFNEFQKLIKSNFSNPAFFGQKGVVGVYIIFVNWLLSFIPKGRLRWFIGSFLKMFFRGSKVKNISYFRYGFMPVYFIAVASNK